MRILLQRVTNASVRVGERVAGEIGPGLLALAGIAETDGEEVLGPMAAKVLNLRLFPGSGADSPFHRSLLETGGELLVVSQFTLYADTRRGRRPGFTEAARPPRARALFDAFVGRLRAAGPRVATGEFGAMMEVRLVNDGPVTIWLDSRDLPAFRAPRAGTSGSTSEEALP